MNLTKLQPGLYIVSTPIGNLEDITLRALNVLKASDIIVCEDTRVTQKLLAKHNIKSILIPYNDQSDSKAREKIIEHIRAGKVVSIVSDAGTPLISDPGYKLVKQVKESNLYLDAAPGPSSVIAGLTLSGLPSDSFYFGGFLPKTSESRKAKFLETSQLNATLIFFETAIRLLSTLADALEVLGDREVCVARELTKFYQEAKTDNIKNVIEYYQNNTLKGEIVLLISGVSKQDLNIDLLNQEIVKMLESGLTAKNTTDLIYDKYKNLINRSEIYRLVNQVKRS